MYEFKQVGKYLRVNLLGPGPRLIKKNNLPGRGLTKVEKYCCREMRTGKKRNVLFCRWTVKCLIKLSRHHNWKLCCSLHERGKQTRVVVDEHCSCIPELVVFLTENT